MNILDILKTAMAKDTSDVFLVAGLPVTYKVKGHQLRQGDRLLPEAINDIVGQIYQVSGRDRLRRRRQSPPPPPWQRSDSSS